MFLALAACGSKAAPTGLGKSSAPDPTKFRAMTPEEQCKATAPRATRCATELLIEDMRETFSREPADTAFVDDVAKRIGNEPRPTAAEAARMHEAKCLSDLSHGYPAAVARCWNMDDCREFATCVTRKR
jgi:hypothetical protein